MKKFMVLYFAPVAWTEQMQGAPAEEMKKGMDAWMAWSQKCGSGLADMGAPLGNGQKVMANGTGASTKEIVGYSVLQAETKEQAKEMLKGHPHLDMANGCEIEVYESMPLPGE